jgi:hypothetical protein
VRLSGKDKHVQQSIQLQYADVTETVEQLTREANHDLWKAIVVEWEFFLQQKSFFQRVMEQRNKRESLDVQIIKYTPKYKKILGI